MCEWAGVWVNVAVRVCLCFRVYMCVRVYVGVCVYVSVSVWIDVSGCLCECMCMCVDMWVCEHMWMCVCVCVSMCMCVDVFVGGCVYVWKRQGDCLSHLKQATYLPLLWWTKLVKSGEVFLLAEFFFFFLTGTVSALNLQEGFLRCDGDSSCALGAGSQLLVKASAQRRKLQPDYGVGSQLHHVSTIWKVLAYSHLPVHPTLPNNWALTCPSCQIPFLPSLMIAIF